MECLHLSINMIKCKNSNKIKSSLNKTTVWRQSDTVKCNRVPVALYWQTCVGVYVSSLIIMQICCDISNSRTCGKPVSVFRLLLIPADPKYRFYSNLLICSLSNIVKVILVHQGEDIKKSMTSWFKIHEHSYSALQCRCLHEPLPIHLLKLK